jgi:hypothetical protein
MLITSFTGLALVCAVVFGLMAALLTDPQVKRGSLIAFIVALVLLGVLVLVRFVDVGVHPA